MLEARELCKVYKPKKGVAVTALDRVNIKFPEKGMVFLLGKSGSGKSTLLNLLGGLDSYSGGEILIKGETTDGFSQKQLDSYRNTYVGFIFQEYNILEEFTVGANIALAIELQGRKATEDEINSILERVDLSSYGNRKPNELSGGQKQRVAIARALVKNPEIIMADEPTGALDSETGRQVLEALKKLSADKLVIIVSHDREFAESYADRIIELSDGRVISDVTASNEKAEPENGKIEFNGKNISLPPRYRLTEQDREQINAYLEKLESGAELTVCGNTAKRFAPTDQKALKAVSPGGMELIKSKLPIKSAVKIGASGLKYKKLRLVMTVLLSCIAFGLFGLSDTFGAYNHIKTCTNSIIDSGIKSVSVEKQRLTAQGEYWTNYGFTLSKAEIRELSEKTGVKMFGVYVPKSRDFSYDELLAPEESEIEQEYDIYQSDFTGFSEISEDILKQNGLKLLSGSLPDASRDEAAVSEYVYEVFKKYGIVNSNGTISRVESYSDIIGLSLPVCGKQLRITGIIDTELDFNRYKTLIVTDENKKFTNTESIMRYALFNEFCTTVNYSYAKLLMVGEGYVEKMISAATPVYPIVDGYIYYDSTGSSQWHFDPMNFTTLSRLPKQEILWVNGEKKALSDDEIIVSSDQLQYDEENSNDPAELLKSVEAMGSLEMYACQRFTDDEELWSYTEDGKKIVGILITENDNSSYFSTTVVSEKLFNTFCADSVAPYSFAVGKMPESREEVQQLVKVCYNEENNVKFPLQNSVTYELDSINGLLKQLSRIFLYIGIGFACFAALMLANFIATSIAHKKQEIGILRAIGSRSNDVFRIFFSESLIIAAVNFILSAIGVGVATLIINQLFRSQLGILITVLSFGIRQILLLAAVSIAVALLASYIPVKRIASKRPIDAIRNR